MTLTARRLLEMKSGRDALLHTVGEAGSVCVKQLPYPGVCEASDDHNTHRDPWRFGYALAASFMKLTRPEVDYRIDIECMFDLCSYVEAMPNEQTRHGFLCGIETLPYQKHYTREKLEEWAREVAPDGVKNKRGRPRKNIQQAEK